MRDARFEKCIAFDPTGAAVFQLVARRIKRLLHGSRHPEAEGITDERAVKFFRRDTDDRVLHAVQILGAADDVRIAAIALLPSPVTDHGHRMRVAPRAFLWSKPATKNRLDTERIEIICRDNCTRRTLSAIAHT